MDADEDGAIANRMSDDDMRSVDTLFNAQLSAVERREALAYLLTSGATASRGIGLDFFRMRQAEARYGSASLIDSDIESLVRECAIRELFAQDQVAEANAALAQHEAQLAGEPEHRSASTPIAELRGEFGLSAAAIDVLLAIAAPSLRGAVARLYGILGNDPGRAMVDELIVDEYSDEVALRAASDRSSALARSRLFEVSRPHRAGCTGMAGRCPVSGLRGA